MTAKQISENIKALSTALSNNADKIAVLMSEPKSIDIEICRYPDSRFVMKCVGAYCHKGNWTFGDEGDLALAISQIEKPDEEINMVELPDNNEKYDIDAR